MKRDYETQFDGCHLRIWRRDGKPLRCGWDVLQRIKDEVAGPDAVAVEIFPARDRVVDETSMRHLWIVRPGSIPDLLRR